MTWLKYRHNRQAVPFVVEILFEDRHLYATPDDRWFLKRDYVRLTDFQKLTDDIKDGRVEARQEF